MRWDTVLFDMDGTLTDSQEGIVKSVSYALERLGRELPPRDTLTAFIGPPLHESFSAICGMDEAETERAVCEFRDYFARRGWAENVPYEGLLPRQVKADAAVGAVHRVALQDQKADRREQDQAQQNDQNDPSRTTLAVVAAVSLCRWHPSHLPFKLYGHFTSMEKENQQKFVNSC